MQPPRGSEAPRVHRTLTAHRSLSNDRRSLQTHIDPRSQLTLLQALPARASLRALPYSSQHGAAASAQPRPHPGAHAPPAQWHRGTAGQFAAAALSRSLLDGLQRNDDAAATAAVAAGVIPALALIVCTSPRPAVLRHSSRLLAELALRSPQRAAANVAAGCAAPLVQLMGSDSADLRSSAISAVAVLTRHSAIDDHATIYAIVAAGALPAAIRNLSNDDEAAKSAALSISNLAVDSPRRKQAMHEAGGAAALVGCLQRSSVDQVHKATLTALYRLAADSAERCRAIAAAGGAAASSTCGKPPAPPPPKRTPPRCCSRWLSTARARQSRPPTPPTLWKPPCRSACRVGTQMRSGGRRQPPCATWPQPARPCRWPALLQPPSRRALLHPPHRLRPRPALCCAGLWPAALRRPLRNRALLQRRLRAHWREHRRECRRMSAERAAAEGAASEAGPSHQP